MIWLGILAPLGGILPLPAGPFVPPDEGAVVFRRDRLPLDVDLMRELSQHLASLAMGQGGTHAADRRTVAQMIALALAIQPENSELRNFATAFGKGQQQAQGDPKQFAQARVRAWEILGWLESPEAGADGHALAACLGDVMTAVDPKHPRAAAWKQSGEQGEWRNWVKPVAEFDEPSVTVNDPALIPTAQPTDKAKPAEPIQLAKATLTTVLWTAGDKTSGGSAMRPMPITMAAKPVELPTSPYSPGKPPGKSPGKPPGKPPDFSCQWNGGQTAGDEGSFKTLCWRVKETIELGHDPFPSGINLAFSPVNRLTYLFDQDRSAISGTLAVLMKSAVRGVEPQATVIGEIGKDGSFQLPSRFWERLRALADGPGGRLVLPSEAATYLPSILALDNPEFFMKYEVLLAASLDELSARSAKTPAAELADVTARFSEITSKIGSQAVPEYVANRFIRQRLDELARAAPFHASARMLAVQGAAKRPTTLPRAILANELLMAVRPMAWIPKEPLEDLVPDTLINTFDTCKTRVARLERCAQTQDRDLLDLTNNLVVTIRTLSRALRNKTDASGGFSNHSSDFDIFNKSYEKSTETLKALMGSVPAN